MLLKFRKIINNIKIKNNTIKKQTKSQKQIKIRIDIQNLAYTLLLENNSIKYYLIDMLFPLNQGIKKILMK